MLQVNRLYFSPETSFAFRCTTQTTPRASFTMKMMFPNLKHFLSSPSVVTEGLILQIKFIIFSSTSQPIAAKVFQEETSFYLSKESSDHALLLDSTPCKLSRDMLKHVQPSNPSFVMRCHHQHTPPVLVHTINPPFYVYHPQDTAQFLCSLSQKES